MEEKHASKMRKEWTSDAVSQAGKILDGSVAVKSATVVNADLMEAFCFGIDKRPCTAEMRAGVGGG